MTEDQAAEFANRIDRGLQEMGILCKHCTAQRPDTRRGLCWVCTDYLLINGELQAFPIAVAPDA